MRWGAGCAVHKRKAVGVAAWGSPKVVKVPRLTLHAVTHVDSTVRAVQQTLCAVRHQRAIHSNVAAKEGGLSHTGRRTPVSVVEVTVVTALLNY